MKVEEFLEEMRALAVEVEGTYIHYNELAKDETFVSIGQVEPVETEIEDDGAGKKREEEHPREKTKTEHRDAFECFSSHVETRPTQITC